VLAHMRVLLIHSAAKKRHLERDCSGVSRNASGTHIIRSTA